MRQSMSSRQRSLFALLLALLLWGLSPRAGAQSAPEQLNIDGVSLGQTIEQLRPRHQDRDVARSQLIPGGKFIIVGDAGVHFLNGRAQAIGGTKLMVRTETLLEEGFSEEQVLAVTKQRGWPFEARWNGGSHVAEFHHTVLRFSVSNDVHLVVVLFKSDFSAQLPWTVSEIYLKNRSVPDPHTELRDLRKTGWFLAPGQPDRTPQSGTREPDS